LRTFPIPEARNSDAEKYVSGYQHGECSHKPDFVVRSDGERGYSGSDKCRDEHRKRLSSAATIGMPYTRCFVVAHHAARYTKRSVGVNRHSRKRALFIRLFACRWVKWRFFTSVKLPNGSESKSVLQASFPWRAKRPSKWKLLSALRSSTATRSAPISCLAPHIHQYGLAQPSCKRRKVSRSLALPTSPTHTPRIRRARLLLPQKHPHRETRSRSTWASPTVSHHWFGAVRPFCRFSEKNVEDEPSCTVAGTLTKTGNSAHYPSNVCNGDLTSTSTLQLACDWSRFSWLQAFSGGGDYVVRYPATHKSRGWACSRSLSSRFGWKVKSTLSPGVREIARQLERAYAERRMASVESLAAKGRSTFTFNPWYSTQKRIFEAYLCYGWIC